MGDDGSMGLVVFQKFVMPRIIKGEFFATIERNCFFMILYGAVASSTIIL